LTVRASHASASRVVGVDLVLLQDGDELLGVLACGTDGGEGQAHGFHLYVNVSMPARSPAERDGKDQERVDARYLPTSGRLCAPGVAAAGTLVLSLPLNRPPRALPTPLPMFFTPSTAAPPT